MLLGIVLYRTNFVKLFQMKKPFTVMVIYKNVIIILEKIIASYSTLSYTKEYQGLEK